MPKELKIFFNLVEVPGGIKRTQNGELQQREDDKHTNKQSMRYSYLQRESDKIPELRHVKDKNYILKIQPPGISLTRKPNKRFKNSTRFQALQNQPGAVIDNRNRAWNYDERSNQSRNEEDKVEDLNSNSRQDEEAKTHSNNAGTNSFLPEFGRGSNANNRSAQPEANEDLEGEIIPRSRPRNYLYQDELEMELEDQNKENNDHIRQNFIADASNGDVDGSINALNEHRSLLE